MTGATSCVTFFGVVAVPTGFSAMLATIGSYTLGFSAIAILALASGVVFLRTRGRD